MDDYSRWLLGLNILSIISSLLVILGYILSDRIKTFGIKQICKLCLFDVIFSFGNLFIKGSFLDSSTNTTYCYLSYFFKFFGVEGSQMMTCLIAFLVCLSIKANGDIIEIQKIRKYSTYLTIFLVIISILLPIIPIILNEVQLQGYYCYMSLQGQRGLILRIIIQFIPQFIYVFLMLYYSIQAYIKSNKQQNSVIVSNQFLFFPLAMIITQLPIIIERLYETFGDHQPIQLWIDISFILLSLNGFINTIIYGLCTDIFIIMKENLSECCQTLFKKKNKRRNDDESNDHHYISMKSNIQQNYYNNHSQAVTDDDSLLTQNK